MKLLAKCKEMANNCQANQVPQEINEVVEAFGGVDNILAMNNSVSELRYDLKDVNKLDKATLEKLGANKIKVFDREKHVQVCFGGDVQELNQLVKKYAPQLKEELACASVSQCYSETSEVKNDSCNSVCETKCDAKDNSCCDESQKECCQASCDQVSTEDDTEFLAPVSGKVVSLESLNDGVFSEKLVGNGLAIQFDLNASKMDVIAPYSGKISMMPANKTQLIFTSANGVETVMVIGKDSAKLDGIGIDAHFGLNDSVSRGQVLMTVNVEKFKEENVDNNFIISTTSDSKFQILSDTSTQAIAGEKLFKLN
ncbi:PTS glucose transporter subunit IIA [Mycoplasma buteonis]|uniref:PTS glucose transporter subunit IIA n=1 Tax=Mycoplasma buteonis TaxID=171280 RepID=UPI00068F1EEB|nr:PTS glucose transporter subunit IIA [Mycoplasma buteonis]